MKSNHIESISREAALPALAFIYYEPIQLFGKDWSPFWREISELLGLDEIKDGMIE